MNAAKSQNLSGRPVRHTKPSPGPTQQGSPPSGMIITTPPPLDGHTAAASPGGKWCASKSVVPVPSLLSPEWRLEVVWMPRRMSSGAGVAFELECVN